MLKRTVMMVKRTVIHNYRVTPLECNWSVLPCYVDSFLQRKMSRPSVTVWHTFDNINVVNSKTTIECRKFIVKLALEVDRSISIGVPMSSLPWSLFMESSLHLPRRKKWIKLMFVTDLVKMKIGEFLHGLGVLHSDGTKIILFSSWSNWKNLSAVDHRCEPLRPKPAFSLALYNKCLLYIVFHFWYTQSSLASKPSVLCELSRWEGICRTVVL